MKFATNSLHLTGCTAKRLTDEFPEKSWTKRSVKNKLLKKLRDAGTVDRRSSRARPRRLAVPALKKITMPSCA